MTTVQMTTKLLMIDWEVMSMNGEGSDVRIAFSWSQKLKSASRHWQDETEAVGEAGACSLTGRWREMAGDGGRWRETTGDGGRWR